MLEAYRQHAQERAALGIPPLPLDAKQVTALVELLKSPPAGEESFLLDLLTHRIPPGVDDAAKVKASFLAAGEYDQWHSLAPVASVAQADALTLAVPLALLGLPEGQELRFVAALARGEELLEVQPKQAGLAVEMPGVPTLA